MEIRLGLIDGDGDGDGGGGGGGVSSGGSTNGYVSTVTKAEEENTSTMEHREKIKVIVFSIACFAAVSIFAASHYRRRRKLKPSSSNPCYLQSDSKPQETFKRILADNSYTPFKQLNRTKQEKHLMNSHPYEEEITNLLVNPQIQFFNFVTGKVDLEMSGSHVWVETESQLQEVVEALSKGFLLEEEEARGFVLEEEEVNQHFGTEKQGVPDEANKTPCS